MFTEIIALYAITEDLLKAVGHHEDCRCQMSDAEVTTATLVAALLFGGNHVTACQYWQEHGWMPRMLRPFT
jgi:hypothetical protein